ncbi:MAG: M24 family metallopeptidase [Gemmatimonas sp.]|nr:M24 family metallopeptidase [Gemmatimonas sp.]
MESRQPPRTFGPPRPLEPSIFAARRERLFERIGDGVALVPAASELFSSRDTEVPYRPSSDLYYLSGIVEPEAVAVLTPHDSAHRFTLFVRPRDPERERWSGARIGPERAAEISGADAVYPLPELADRLPELLASGERIYYPLGAVSRIDGMVMEGLLRARRARQRSGVGPIGVVDLEAVTSELRIVKGTDEVDQIRFAAEISAEAHRIAMERTRPGVGEWEVQAALEAAFRTLGAARPAFPSIVGAGANATVLHYVANQSRMRDGELLLIDAGAERGMYSADITRTFPVSGVFSGAQRDLYEVVLEAEEAGIATAAPGSTAADIHSSALGVLVHGMIDLGILRADSVEEVIDSGSYKRFYPHQTSHWLGLDVHDVGPYRRNGAPVTLVPGMVLTVEPGIYVPADSEDVPGAFRGVGIRIEDNVHVVEGGCEVLTRSVPVAIAEIEALMRGD